MKKSSKKYFGFTLVELIIVITILAILSTIAFVSFQSYTKSSRDSVRLSNLSNIEKSLEVFNVKSGTYPTPDNKINISLSGSDVSYQGTLGDKSSSILGFAKAPTDPLDNSNYYYATNAQGKSYSLVSFAENQTSFVSNQALADNSNKSTLTKGNLSYLLDANNNTLTSNIDLFGNASGTSFVQVLNNTTKLTGSGIELGGGFQMLALGNGNYSSPSTCPEGFIPVGGSTDFSQPGFCVMKYEASYDDGDNVYGTDSNSTNYVIGKKIYSTEGKYPIGNSTQSGAINSCNLLGNGYHLITNNEWMTIARQIENNYKNWNTGIVGSGYIYTGLSFETTGCNIGKYGYETNLYGTKTGSGGNNNCDKKRQLILSNNEIIWDLSGNIWEHVNKSNTIDGSYNNAGFLFLDNISNYNSTTGRNNNGFLSSGLTASQKQKFGPLNNNFGHNEGVGGIGINYGTLPSYNILVKGCSAKGTNNFTGIYSTFLTASNTSNWGDLGFRCAYIKQ